MNHGFSVSPHHFFFLGSVVSVYHDVLKDKNKYIKKHLNEYIKKYINSYIINQKRK